MGGNTLLQFRMLGFNVRLDTSWIFIAGLITWSLATRYLPYVLPNYYAAFYWLLALAGAAGFFLSILLHEMGHAVTARRFGIPVLGVTLLMFGGITQMARRAKSPKEEILISGAGPLVNFLLGCLFLVLAGLARSLELGAPILVILNYLSWINFILAIINVVPAFPLDGGQIFRALMWKFLGDYPKATRIAARIGMVFSYALMAWAAWALIRGDYIGGLWWFFIAIMLHNAAKAAVQHYK
ncbi:MAG: site-2 protease family protein [Robiginitomaculum sp.]|nr:site-2 protease family protein [Robiginitomaculum sp.]